MPKWFSRRAIAAHVTIVVLLPSFALLANWQLSRALGGNGLSWAYTVEWPIFGVYSLVLWWRVIHDVDDVSRPTRRRFGTSEKRMQKRALAEAREARELQRYNAYLASLQQHEHEKRSAHGA